MREQEYLEQLRELWARNRPQHLPAEPAYPFGEVPLTTYLRRWAAERGAHPVVDFYGAELTFAELDERSDRFASLLLDEGFRRGDRVAVFMSNCPQFFVAFFGVLKAGCVYAPMNPLFKVHELRYELSDAGATGIVVTYGLLPLVREVTEDVGLRLVLATGLADWLPDEPTLPLPPALREPDERPTDVRDFTEALRDHPVRDDLPEPGLDDLAALNYTGGTTGMPKGCEHTQGDMVYTAATAATYLCPVDPDSVAVVVIPLFWIAGEDAGLLLPVFSGSTVVLLNRWDPRAVLEAVDRYRVTLMLAPVDSYFELLAQPDADRFDLSSLAHPVTMSLIRKLGVDEREAWQKAVGAHSVLREAAYGMTETHTMDTFTTGLQDDDRDLRSRPVFVGLPVPGTEFKIVDFETGELVPLDGEGEICVRSPSLLTSYWNKPEETAEALRDGWLHTGDIGTLDRDGFLHYLGRNKEMLKVKGMSVFPSEVEALLGRRPDVAGSGVVGRPDPERGEVPVAFVQLRADAGDVDAAEIEAWCREHMASYKVPEVRLVQELPLTATGKVMKEPLREQLG